MSWYYVQSLLPKWITIRGEEGEFDITDVSIQFQVEWETKFSSLWYSLTDSEKERITPIEPPYTEESVSAFLELLKQTKENRGVLDSIISVFSDVTEDKEFPHSEQWRIVNTMKELLKDKTHPVLFSRMNLIEPGAFMMGALEEDEEALLSPGNRLNNSTLQHLLMHA